MTRLTHDSILKSGRYADLRIAEGEADTALALYRFMLRLRLCEEALAREYHPADEMRCPVHFCVGQEAVPAALSLLLRDDDYLYSHHRSHGYYLAKHAPMPELFAELYGKGAGANAGLAGSQDISFPARRFFSGAILAGATAISAGSALAFQLARSGQVAVAGFGESATDEGVFWECVNYAALAKLPLVLVCENNNYSVFSPQLKRAAADNISERVAAFGMAQQAIFGNDALLAHRTLREALARARAGEGPTFVEAYTYRWSGHYGPASDDLVGYREPEELEAWKRNCPLTLLEEGLRAARLLDDAAKRRWTQESEAEVDACFRFAKSSPFPAAPEWRLLNLAAATPEADRLLVDAELHEFDAHQQSEQAKGISAPMKHERLVAAEVTYAEALRQGLHQAMELSGKVLVIGQLVDYAPGVFGSTSGLAERFGAGRVRDFPVAESAMTAVGVGAAIAGLRPVLVHHRLDFMLYSMDAIVNWLSLWRFKSNGQSAAPVTIRAIVGRGWGQGPQHSKSLHAWFAHLPGIKVAMPATAFDAKGLLLESIFGEDPVIMIEHRSLFTLKGAVPAVPYRVRFGKAAVRRAGEDLTLVAAGVTVPLALRVAARLAAEGISGEVIDLRTLSPLDTDTVCASVEKTGRLAVLDSSWLSFGASAEVVARVAERVGRRLRADPVRIAHPDSHTPMSRALEDAYYPDEATVSARLRAMVR